MSDSDQRGKRWPKERTVNFLNYVKKYPCLWDPNNDNYKTIAKRTTAYEEIATLLNSTKTAVQRKFNYLVCYYTREVKRKDMSNFDPSSTSSELVEWFGEAQFLCAAARKRSGSNAVTEVEISTTNEEMHALNSNVCRVCFGATKEENGLPCINIVDTFKFCTGFDIKLDSYYPMVLCSSCNAELMACCAFLLKSKQAERILEMVYCCSNQSEASQLFTDLLNKERKDDDQAEVYCADNIRSDCDENMGVYQENEMLDTIQNVGETTETAVDVNMTGISTEKDPKPKPQKCLPKIKEIICQICGKLVLTSRMHGHLKAHNPGNVRYKCDMCDKDFKRSEALSHHKRIHTQDRRYQCQFCDQKFMYWGDRRYHIRSKHMKVKPFKCQICQKGFLERQSMNMHIEQEHCGNVYKCDKCGNTLKNRRSLSSHMRQVHCDTEEIICNVCQKGFKTKRYLKQHYITHSGERNYKCPVGACGMAFGQNHVMRTHVLKQHPHFKLPPSGTIVSAKALERLKKEQENNAKLVKTDIIV